ncbi:MAG: asparaginase [Candidatus Thermoplasmatota archaeon]|nr:asparaginase [Candidatus Thermoplasmatota archaeon]MEC7142607.1 asparaginase [Candidatus Thermoplasmatota archaeon]MEC7436292.1 asparaginase [Candidatus Thermoplasmatota archaeon]MEC7462608.1 asparaginase [Candidatus Thermoplasmatota archaeon]MEC7543939.1 asparaginase [Candidatus Thermoplasmatota archaeon]|tara:strand:+ start:3051 stop:4208 length:1158 start_codon:yes stop_codon:yes gene_type:complete
MTEQDRPSSVSHGRPGSRIYPSNPLGEKYEGIPTGRDVEWEPLVDFRRLDVSENTIHGAISWVHGDEVIHSFGGNVLVYGRSMMKPLLMKIFTDVLDDVLTDKQKAIACSSHNGDTEHVATAQSILTESEWGLMQCPLDVPLVQFGRQVRRPRRWFHTCSGEHAALLRALRLKGINRAGYTLPTSSWFQDFIDLLNSMLHPDWKPLRIAKDGCGLPTVSNTVDELATLFSALVRTKDDDWIWDAMCKHPDLIGGFNRLDSTIIKAGEGRVLAKEGADGLLGIAIEHDDWPKGLGIVIKIAHGWNSQATWYVARAVLGVLGIQLRNPYPLHRQKAFIVPGIVPEMYLKQLETVVTWDEWDPDQDRFQILENQDELARNPHGNEGRM